MVGSTSGPSNIFGTQTPTKESRSSTGEGNSSALHWLADLATQKAKDDTKGSVPNRPQWKCGQRSLLLLNVKKATEL